MVYVLLTVNCMGRAAARFCYAETVNCMGRAAARFGYAGRSGDARGRGHGPRNGRARQMDFTYVVLLYCCKLLLTRLTAAPPPPWLGELKGASLAIYLGQYT